MGSPLYILYGIMLMFLLMFRNFVSDPSTSVVALEACGDWSLQNIRKYISKTSLLFKYFFKPSIHRVSTVTHVSYPCINKDDYPATCNSANLI